MFVLGKARNCESIAEWEATSSYHLLRDHDHCLDREFAVAVVKQIFQAWSEEINDQYIVKSFLAEVVDIWYSGYAHQCLVTRQDCQTHGSRPRSCRSGTRPLAAAHRFSSVPRYDKLQTIQAQGG